MPCTVQPSQLPAGAVPAGAAAVWVACDELWALTDAGPARRLAKAAGLFDPVLSPDRRYVAFTKYHPGLRSGGPNDLAVVPTAGGAVQVLVDGTELTRRLSPSNNMPPGSWTYVTGVRWLPDSTAVGFTTGEFWVDLTSDESGWADNLRDDHWTATMPESELRQVLPPRQGGHFVYSSDGRQVALTRDADELGPHRATIAVANADGTGHRVLLEHSPMSSGSDWRPYQRPQWSPDGQSLLAVQPTPYSLDSQDPWAELDGPGKLLRLGLDGTTTPIADAGGGSLSGAVDYSAWWSPDGSHVAYLAAQPTPSDTPAPGYPRPAPSAATPTERALVIATTTGDVVATYRLPADGVGGFAWSPDGRRFAFRSWTLTGQTDATFTTMLGGLDVSPRTAEGIEAAHPLGWLGPDHLLVVTPSTLEVVQVDDSLAVMARTIVAQMSRLPAYRSVPETDIVPAQQ